MLIRISLALLIISTLLPGCIGASHNPADTVSTSVIASSLTGSPVSSLTGARLGPVAAVVLDIETGNIKYIIVSLADYRQGKLIFTGVKRLVPVPWEFLSATSQRQELVLNLQNEDVVYLAPSFMTMPDTDAEGWDAAVQTFWAGQEPAIN
jgi:sporulation protein YlmC with PRC-barrel domain